MKPTLFISDLHLCVSRPHINRIFFTFMERIAPKAQALYVLGDLFEYWAGDDDLDDSFNAQVISAFRNFTEQQVPLYIIHGNRDFLMGEEFARACNAKLLPDPSLIDLYGTPTLIMHGDTLCTDDTAYQAFRAQVRDPAWQKGFLSQPLSERKAAIEKLRAQSEQEKSQKSEAIMDVAPATMDKVLHEYHYPRLIHGHTHRPAKHVHVVDGKNCERWVLSDWYKHGEYLRCDESGCSAIKL
ncbi:MAG TPA: UDP-2,3-diacylglucosamine diphosphatase [Burkholderiales bacterium]|nr:UDP-2,3-diacylglucosamine diphosphatase [Burkholderiales bacterium]